MINKEEYYLQVSNNDKDYIQVGKSDHQHITADMLLDVHQYVYVRIVSSLTKEVLSKAYIPKEVK